MGVGVEGTFPHNLLGLIKEPSLYISLISFSKNLAQLFLLTLNDGVTLSSSIFNGSIPTVIL